MATIHKNLSEQGKNIASAAGMKIALVVAEWNAEITEGLKKGAVETLNKQGIYDRDLSVHYVPGCFELPLGAQTILEKGEVVKDLETNPTTLKELEAHFAKSAVSASEEE